MPKSKFGIVWRDQNEAASKAVLRRTKATEQARQDRSTKDLELATQGRSQIPGTLPQDFEGYALSFFFDSYIMLATDPNLQNGYLGSLYPVWKTRRPLSPLQPAVTAVALSLLEAWSLRNPNLQQSLARLYYVQAISAVRQQLNDAKDVDDDVLMATLMLDMYDGIISFCGARGHEGLHVAGSRALVESRRKHPIDSEASQRIVLGARSHVIGRALSKREPLSDEVSTWTRSMNNIPRTPKFELEELEYRLANLQASASALKSATPRRYTLAYETLARIHELDKQLIQWTATIPDDWVPIHIRGIESIPSSIRNAGLYQPHCIIHKSIFTANVLNGHCCSRIKVQLIKISCIDHLESTLLASGRTNACNIIQEMADTICASVPFFLGDRVSVRRFDDRCVRYPHLGDSTSEEHYKSAAAYAGIFLSQRIAELLQPGLPLRPGQVPWVLGQMRRIKNIYMASSGVTS